MDVMLLLFQEHFDYLRVPAETKATAVADKIL